MSERKDNDDWTGGHVPRGPRAVWSLANKITLLVCVLSIAGSLPIGILTYQRMKNSLIQRQLESLEARSVLNGATLRSLIDSLREDALTLVGTPPILGIHRARENGGTDPLDGSSLEVWRARLTNIFEVFLRAKPSYFQIRYITVEDEGREYVRVERWGNSLISIPEDRLQQKGNRPYFTETIKLAPGQAYISELDLNKEEGKVVEPWIPVLRAAVPSYGPDGSILGIVIINYDTTEIFGDLEAGLVRGQQALVFNDRGDFLLHPNRAKTFGFDFEERHTFAELDPEFQLTELQKPKTVFDVATNAISWNAVHFDPLRPARFFGVAVTAPASIVLKETGTLRDQTIALGFALVAIASMLAYFSSRSITGALRSAVLAAEDIRRGIRNLDIDTHASDETGTLARALKTMAEEIQEAEAATQKYLAVVHDAEDAIMSFDGEARIRAWNSGAERVYGYSEAEALAMKATELVPHEARQDLLEFLGEVGAGHHRSGVESERVTKQGSRFPVSVTSTRIFDARTKSWVVSVIERDVSVQLEARRVLQVASDEQAQLNAVLAERNQELDEFAHVISHDLKAPLRGIGSLVDWIEDELHETASDETRENLSLLRSRTTWMQQLIDGVLRYSRAWRSENADETFDTAKVVNDTLSAIGAPSEMIIRVLGEFPMLHCDRVQFTQVIQNLLSNAVKFMDKPNGEIVVECAELDEVWEFAVTDNGPGIENQYLDKIFRIFQTLQMGESFESTGVGLAVVRKIVSRMGGEIRVTSQVGEGSRFAFTLPKQDLETLDQGPEA